MRNKSVIKYLLIISILFVAGCPNAMIGLGDKVDIDAPELSIGNYGDGTAIVNGDYVKGEITLTGATSDDIGIKSVKLSFDGGLTFSNATVASNQLSWSYTIDTATVEDGEKDIIVLVSDTSETPKTSEERLLLYFDNTAPLVEVTVSPGFAAPASDSTFSIKGEATDPYRIKSVSVSMTQGSGALSTVEGTNTWSFVLSNAATGSYKFEITAEDYAGNINSHFFHYNDINTLNNGSYISIEDLYKIENGETVAGSIITQSSLAGIELTELPLYVDMNDDVPVITISNPEVAAQLGGNAIVIGRVEDDDAVDTASLQISIDGGAWEWDSGLPGTEITGSGQAVNFKYDISSLGNGAHSIAIKASDDHSTTKTSDTVNFTIDLGAPQISITSPSQGEYLDIATVALTGTAYDDQSVSSVKVQLDGEVEANWRDAVTSNGYSDWTYTTPSLSEGIHTVKVYAEDGTGKVSSYNISFYVDTTFPTVSFNYPVMNSEVYGDVTLLGVCSDNFNAFTSGFIKVGKDGSWTAMTNLNYWSYSLPNLEGTYANTSSSNDLGNGIWELPVTFKVTDVAGNETITVEADYSFHINASLDKPETVITYPSTGFKTGGPVTIRGTSYDEQQVFRVEMRLDLNDDGAFDTQIDLNGTNGTNDPFEDETKWYPVSGTLNWQQELNSSSELFGLSADGDVNIQVRAIDTKDGENDGTIGDPQILTVTFDNSYPYFDNLSHSSFDYAKGTFTLTAQAHDPQVVSSILISYNGGTSYTDITSSSTYIDDTQYDISQSIDTTSYVPTSGVLPLKLKVVDNASNSTDTAINLNVDNILPSGSWTGVLDDINGAAFKVQGEAIDSGTVSGIDKIEIYFVRGGNVYNPSLVNTTSAVGTNDFGDGNGNVDYTTDANYKITIDDLDELGDDGSANGDLDTFDESLTLSGSTYSWWAEFNSENIPDGALDVHYVVWDEAENAQHYMESGFIKNNPPTLDLTTVGTDLDWSDSVEIGEQFTYSESFNAQNRLYISVTVTDDKPGLTYKLFRGTDNTGILESTNFSTTVNISTYSDGTEFFYYEIMDSDDIIISKLIEVIIDNTDETDPTISIDALTQGNVIDGHLELSGDSFHNGTDPDVSGEIKITGNAWDNQRIKSIYLTLDGVVSPDDLLAAWEGNALVSKNTDFSIDSYSFSEDTGLLITWTYIWDTTSISNIAANDIQAKFDIEDYASTPNTATNSITVDVVPYITGIVREPTNFSTIRSKMGRFPMRRGEALVEISGFNFRNSGNGNGDYIGIDSEKTGLPADMDNTFSTIALSGTDTYTVTIPSDAPSGWLRIFVNNIEAINNINNNTLDINKELDVGNSGSTYWTDDRYILSFDSDLNEFFADGNGDPQFPAMDIASDGTLYSSWTTYSTSDISYSTIGGAVVDVWHGYDPPEFTDITVEGTNINVLYLANYNGGSGWDSNSQTAGGLYLYDDSAPSIRCGRNPSNPTYRFELMYHNQTLLQFRNIRVKRGLNNRIYTSYYDNASGSIKFSSINDGYTYAVNSSETTDEIPWVNIDGGTDGDDTQIVPDINFNIASTAIDGRVSSTGAYSTITLDEDNYPVIVFYDGDNQTMRLARTGVENPDLGSEWNIQEVLGVGDPNFNYSGDYLSAEVDGDGFLHIVSYKSSQGKLIYIKSTNNPESGAAYTFGSSITIDTAAGVWADLYINKVGPDYIPYIAYLDSTGINSFNGLKVAWYDASADTDFDSLPDGDWEYSNIPLANSINNERISLVTANTTGVAWTSGVGYKSGSHYYVTYMYPEQ